MPGLFITFEGSEGAGKTTQIGLLAARLRKLNRVVRVLREPGGTPIGEEIRHTLKHSAANHAMTPEAELLLMNASRAQLVREVIRPALAAGEVILCDRFYDSSTAYQGFGRQMDLEAVSAVIDFAVGDTHPQLTLLLSVPLAVSESRRQSRRAETAPERDRFEEADREFFTRVELGFQKIAVEEPDRIKIVDATGTPGAVELAIWAHVSRLLN